MQGYSLCLNNAKRLTLGTPSAPSSSCEWGRDTPLVISINDLWGLSPAQKVGGGGGVLCQLVVPWASLSLMGAVPSPPRYQYGCKLLPLQGSRKWGLDPPEGCGMKKKSSDPGLRWTADGEAQPGYRVWNYLIFTTVCPPPLLSPLHPTPPLG